MERKHKPTNANQFKFEQTQPFDPDEFNTALNWYENAAMQIAQVSNPTEYGLNIDFGKGKVEHIVFTDTPMNRGLIE